VPAPRSRIPLGPTRRVGCLWTARREKLSHVGACLVQGTRAQS
jgi:hypothetical protein